MTTITTKPVTKEYEVGWERIFGGSIIKIIPKNKKDRKVAKVMEGILNRPKIHAEFITWDEIDKIRDIYANND